MIGLLLAVMLAVTPIPPPYIPPEFQVAYELYPSSFTNADGSLVFAVPRYWQVGLSEEDFELFARVVAAECNGDIAGDYENQCAIASVVWNRTTSDIFAGSVLHVLNEYGQFTTVHSGDCSKETNDACRQAIVDAYQNQLIPEDVIYFNSEGFFKGHKPYMKISDNYFSYE